MHHSSKYEDRLFNEGIEIEDMGMYFRKFPNGRYIEKAKLLQAQFIKKETRRIRITGLASLSIWTGLAYILSDEFITYNVFSCAFLKILLVESALFTFLNIKHNYGIHLCALTLILPICTFNLSPRIQNINIDKSVNERYAIFQLSFDENGKLVKLPLLSQRTRNLTGKTCYVAKFRYTERTKELVEKHRLDDRCLYERGFVDYVFEAPPNRIKMEEIVSVTRRGHTRYRTVVHDEIYKSAISFIPF